MRQQSTKYLLLILLIAVLVVPSIALAAWWNPFSWGFWNSVFHFQQTSQKAPTACPMIAKLCPDGSSVSPQGPKCEVPACPTIQKFLFSVANKNMEIRDKNTGKLIQIIPLTKDVLSWNNNPQVKDVAMSDNDINFDGYKDLQILVSVPADNGGVFDFYIYNPPTGKFTKDLALQNIMGPSFDPTKKIISTYASGGCAGGVFTENTFSFTNGDYILTQNKEGNCCTMDGGSGNYKITVNNFANGKITTTTQEACPAQ